MTYDPIDANDDGTVNADVDNDSVVTEQANLDWLTRYRGPTYFGPIESLDTWRTTSVGGGQVSTVLGGVEITNGANDGGGGSFEYLQPEPPYPIATASWDVDRIIQTRPNFDGGTTSRTDYLTTGRVHNSNRGFGFKLDVDTLEGVVHNGTSETTTALVNSPAIDPELRAEYTAGERVEFYVDGVKEGEITSNLPSGTARSFYLIAIEHIASTADVRRLQIGDVRVVQSEVV